MFCLFDLANKLRRRPENQVHYELNAEGSGSGSGEFVSVFILFEVEYFILPFHKRPASVEVEGEVEKQNSNAGLFGQHAESSKHYAHPHALLIASRPTNIGFGFRTFDSRAGQKQCIHVLILLSTLSKPDGF